MASILRFEEIPLVNLTIGLGQVRKMNTGKEIAELVESIRQVGLLQPIVVAETEEAGMYEIVTGQRRVLAHQELGRERIWSAVLDERIDEEDPRVLSLTENLVRLDLSRQDLIDACTDLYYRYGSINAVTEKTGLPHRKVSEYVKYDRLIPELQSLVKTSQVPLQTALRAQEAAAVTGNVNAEEAIRFAKDMAPLSGAQQSKILKTRNANPAISVDEVIEDAKGGGKITQVVVTLTTDVHTALHSYAQSQETTIDDAAGMLIRDGLYVNDFIEDR